MQDIYFSQAVQAMLDGQNVHAAIGIRFDFASEQVRVWLGRGTFTAADGSIWSGLGELASVDGLNMSPSLATDPINITLSGVDLELLQLTRDQATEIRGQRCAVYLLLFDDNWQSLDTPYLTEIYLMDRATLSVDGESRSITISVTAEPLFYTKHIPAVAFMSDQDQQKKYPGDKIFERVALMAGKQTVIWTQT